VKLIIFFSLLIAASQSQADQSQADQSQADQSQADQSREELVIGTTPQLFETMNVVLQGYQQQTQSNVSDKEKSVDINATDTAVTDEFEYRLVVIDNVASAMARGDVQLGFVARKWTDHEVGEFVEFYGVKPAYMLYAAGAMGLIVNNESPVSAINADNFETIASAYQTCRLANSGMDWSLLSEDETLKNMHIHYLVQTGDLISESYHCKENLSDTDGVTVSYFKHRQDLFAALKQHKNAIAIAPIQNTKEGKYLVILDADGKEIVANAANVISGRYPIASQYYGYANTALMQLNAKPLARYLISDEAQKLLKQKGMLALPEEFRHRVRVLIKDSDPIIAGGYR